ncbi:uncharacterized protein LOC108414420 isoform X3 [Pygocentrus nattereri]|uniref:uncharacterized protein LOC108414420 isoform X3 n=1 Tax=Pygocentrus nattereri TaxID=42514 RepID=UPI001891D79D|nr:uncharacterized protein LOC108414420 isoform X3 [Pygocentrus nattereri]
MRMLVIFVVLLMFRGASMGLLSMNPVCRFTQSDPCYGAVGRPLYLQLPSEYELDLRKRYSGTASSRIFRYRNPLITHHHADYPRWEFVADKIIIIISSAEKRDAGGYTLETFDSAGMSKGVYRLQLVIEETTTHTMPTTAASVSAVTSAVTRCGQMTHLDTSFKVFVSVWLFEIIILLSLLVGAFYIYTRIYKKQRAAERPDAPR